MSLTPIDRPMIHTPGPLEVEVYGDDVIVSGGPTNDDIAKFHHDRSAAVSISKDEALANAQMFVAAEDMLDALQEFAKQNLPDEMDDDQARHADYQGAYEFMVRVSRETVARARGKTP